MKTLIEYFGNFPGLAAVLAVAFLILFFVVLERIIDPPPGDTPVHRKPGRISWRRQRRESARRATRRALMLVNGGGFHAPAQRKGVWP